MSNIEKVMAKLGGFCDCALITSDISRRYFTGMKSSAGTLLLFKDAAYLIIDFRYIEKAKSTVRCCEVIEQDNLFEQINALLKKHNAKSVSIESDYLTVSGLINLTDRLKAEVIPDKRLSGLIASLRIIKSDDEIEKLTKAQRIAEKAYTELLNFISAGRSEREISNELDRLMFCFGAEELSFETIALSGENTSMPHGVPGDRTIKNGDFVLMDFGAVCEGYHSDMTRTVCVGEPSERQREVYDVVLTAQEKALELAGAGITGKQLDAAARNYISLCGFGGRFGHSLGHGVGLEIHEQPNASVNSETVLQENMVVTVEPGIYIQGEFGVRIEDFIVIKNNGFINITNAPKTLLTL